MTNELKSYRDIERQIIEKRSKKEDSMKLTKKLEELATEFERLKKLVKLVDPAEYDWHFVGIKFVKSHQVNLFLVFFSYIWKPLCIVDSSNVGS